MMVNEISQQLVSKQKIQFQIIIDNLISIIVLN